MKETEEKPRSKFCHIGAPACFALEMACKQLNAAFDGQCYVVGSVLQRPDWRDVDVRMMMDDAAFVTLFPNAGGVEYGHWEFDHRWTLMTVAITAWLRTMTGLPVDFQFQPSSFANVRHKGKRQAVGMSLGKVE